MRLLSLFIIFLCLLPLTARAKSKWSLTTDAKIESVYWPQKYGEDTNDTLNRLQLIPTLSAKFGDPFRFHFKPYFQWDPENKSTEEKVFADIGEAYFKLRGDNTSLQVGSNIVNWGVTDGYNPMDIVNMRQYFDPLRSVKLGVGSIMLSNSTEGSEQELIFIPKNREAILPGTQSRWLPRKIYIPRSVDNNVILLLPDNLNYIYESRVILDNALDNNVGLRLQWHLGPVDLSFTGYEGVSQFPLIKPEVTGQIIQISPDYILKTDPDVKLHLKYYKQRAGGFSWVSSHWNFLLKYATNYSQSLSDDPLAPGWTHESIVGLEKNFSIGSEGLLVALVQYSFIDNEKQSDSNISVADIFRRSWMAGGRFSWGDNWTLTVLGLYDTLRYSNFQQYTLSRRLFDTWTLQLSAELITGAPADPLGVYNDNDNYRLSLSRSW